MEKRPQQERSKARVEKILLTTGELLRDIGYEALSTKQVAARAGLPVGTIYQFFPNKDALVQALVARLQEDVEQLAQELASVEATRLQDLGPFIARLVDGIAAIQGRSAGFVCLFAGSPVNSEFEGLVSGLRDSLLQQVERALKDAAPHLTARSLSQTLIIMSEITRGIIAQFDRAEPAERAALIEELKTALTAYVNVKVRAAVDAS